MQKILNGINSWAVLVTVIITVIAVPILIILINIFIGQSETWSHLVEHLLTGYLLNSLVLVVSVGTLSLLIGTACAWVINTYDFYGRRQLEWLLILPLAIPTYIMAFIYSGIFDFSGPVKTFFRNQFGVGLAFLDVQNLYGVIFIMTMVLFPYVYVSALTYFKNASGSLIEASRSLGSTPTRAFLKIVLPASRPALVAGVSLVLMEVLNDYGAVKYYGVNTFTTGIFRSWFSMGDLQAAVFLASMLMAFVFVLILLERWQRGKRRFDQGGRSTQPLLRYKLLGWKYVFALAICLIPLLLGFIIPLLQLVYWTWQTAYKVVDGEFWTLLGNSFLLAGISALVCVMAAILLLYGVRVAKSTRVENISKLSVLGYSIPGAVIAIGIMITLITVDRWWIDLMKYLTGEKVGFLLSGSLFALIFAYLVRYLVVGYNPIDAGFKRISTSLEEASLSLGRGRWVTLFRIDIPILKASILGGALMVFVDVLKELPLTLILRPFNYDTLATKAFQYASDEMVAESAPASLIIILIGLLPIFLLNKLIIKH
ncbi:MAG: iron ABC transporter permease [Bacteroidota bacterium]